MMTKLSIDQALRQGCGFARCGKLTEAERIYREALERFPANRRILSALQGLSAPKMVHPSGPETDSLIGLHSQGKFVEGLNQAEGLIKSYPLSGVAYNFAASFNAALGHLDKALEYYDKAIELSPDAADIYNNRGNTLTARKRLNEALASYDEAIHIKPDYAQAYINRGAILNELGQLDEALASHDRGIQINGNIAEAYNNRGNTLSNLGRLEEALADYDQAICLKPSFVEAYVNRGNALKRMNRLKEAVDCYHQSIAISPRAEAFNNCGAILKELEHWDYALACFDAALKIKPDYMLAMSESFHARRHMCIWGESGPAPLCSSAGSDPFPPFLMLIMNDSPEEQFYCAKAWIRKNCPNTPLYPSRTHTPNRRIRIGYFSSDFYNHATMYLMARLFELHDKTKFEIHAFSYGEYAQDTMRERLVAAVDELHDVASLSDQAIVDLARSKSIDIAIDLKGFTKNTRTGIFSRRAAPIQVNYLGYPGTMGADFMDYIIADTVTIPEEDQKFYSEKVDYLPNSYQVNDNQRKVAQTPYRRSDLGLPEDGFVFCCFNNNYKISPAEFDIWMRLLHQVEGSVLWLLAGNQWATANLRREAEERGIDADRLVFATRMDAPEHLGRQRCADLFLDTFKVNAHTTASDALWVGLPVLTKIGTGFAGRVAASLLYAVGMPELVTETEDAYERLALELATTPHKLEAVRAKLAANRLTTPLFDSETYTRNIETLFERMHKELSPAP